MKIYVLLAVFFVSCLGRNSEQNGKHVSPLYLPSNVADTFIYNGIMSYTVKYNEQKFDTSYSDEVKIVKINIDSFYFLYKQMEYKEYESFGGDSDQYIKIHKTYCDLKNEGDNIYEQRDISSGGV